MGKLISFFKDLLEGWFGTNLAEEQTETEQTAPADAAEAKAEENPVAESQDDGHEDAQSKEDVVAVSAKDGQQEEIEVDDAVSNEDAEGASNDEADAVSNEDVAVASNDEADAASNQDADVVSNDDINAQPVEDEDGENTEETIAVVPDEDPSFIGGFLDGGWLYMALGMLIALVIAFLKARYDRKKREERRRQHKRRKAKEKAAQEMAAQQMSEQEIQTSQTEEHTAVDLDASVVQTSGMRSAVFQDIGSREDQQDSYGMTDPALYQEQGVMAVVADGMGGLANGKAVSSELVSTFLGGFGTVRGYSKPQEILLDLTIRANYNVNERFRGAERSGSTLVSVMVRNGYLHFLTIGDSRLYLYRAGMLLQLNREHIYQEELAVKAVNRKTPISQVTGDRQAHALTSFIGIGTVPYIDRNDEGIKLMPGDRILLCSDGVYGTLSREQMEKALQADVKDAASQMKDLIIQIQKPYQDNNTGLILEYLG